jgi:dTDP-4-amino-4,6-dideoxygalactose transaminase
VTVWYQRIVANPDDTSLIDSACEYFEREYQAGVKEIDLANLRGERVEQVHKQLPGLYGYRYAQLQEIEAILGYLQIRETAIRGQRRRHYIEHYNRALNPTTAEKYVEADDAVLAMHLLINQVALVRNYYVGLTKRHEFLEFRLGDVTRLIVAGVNDALM